MLKRLTIVLALIGSLNAFSSNFANTSLGDNFFIKNYYKTTDVKEIVNSYGAEYESSYQKAKKKNTLQAYFDFLKRYPKTSRTKDAWENIYKLIYRQTEQKNDIKAYKEFIRKYPKAPQIKEAKQHIYELAYKNIENSNNLKSYLEFFKKYPNAPQIKEVLNNIYILWFDEAKQKNTLQSYIKFIHFAKGHRPSLTKKAINNIYEIVKKKNNIENYQWFMQTYPNAPQTKNALNAIYNIVTKKNNISGYQWFVKTYPDATQVKDAFSNIYELAYDKAKAIDTIKAYNTFIYMYPAAPQVKDANDIAYKMEVKKYADLGMFGFYDKDAKMEKRARKLLIKAKLIERYPKDNDLQDKGAGYIIVANRMYQLLQDKFDDTDATLRYLESQEFKDFVSTFKDTMSDIQRTLHKIEKNTGDTAHYTKKLIDISSQGFANAHADREMASYYAKQHRKWQKFMHFRDKGY